MDQHGEVIEAAVPARGRTLEFFILLNLAAVVVGLLALGQRDTAEATIEGPLFVLLLVGGVLRLLLGITIVWLGALPLRSIGLRFDRLGPGLALAGVAWLLAQAGEAARLVAQGAPLMLHSGWSDPGPLALVRLLAGQMIGVALYEETAFRGYLFPQLVLRIRAMWPGHESTAVVLGLLSAQVLFGVWHLPFLGYVGVSPADTPYVVMGITIAGVFFTLLYLWTQNLFFAMGVHALVTAPTPLFASSDLPPWLMIGAMSAVVAALHGVAGKLLRRRL